MKVAIIGSGISGLAAAHTLRGAAEVTLFEAGDYFGGHTHTVDVTLPASASARAAGSPPQVTHGVDTGFLVLNERTYPELIALFKTLGVATAQSEMTFSVQAKTAHSQRALEWSGSSLNTLFAQRRNLVSWRFLNMLRDLLRFNQLTSRIAQSGSDAEMRQSLGEFLKEHRFSAEFCDWYFLPMMACIWSCPTAQMMQFPVSTMIRFCHNHGLLQVSNRPQWWTVQGGAKHYVDKIIAHIDDKRLNCPVRKITRQLASQVSGQIAVTTDHGSETFDHVILATHSDQALALLGAPTATERSALGAIRYHPNRAVLHTDASVLPQRKTAWAAWNYERSAGANAGANSNSNSDEAPQVCLHYLINRLQPLPFAQPVVVSLNPLREIAPEHVLGAYDYAHPVFDQAAVKAQRQMPWLQGQHNTYYCGAWMGYGFHEDGLKAGVAAATQLLANTGRAAA